MTHYKLVWFIHRVHLLEQSGGVDGPYPSAEVAFERAKHRGLRSYEFYIIQAYQVDET